MQTATASELLGIDLKDFRIVQMTMVEKGDEEGKSFHPIGLYQSESLAKTYTAQNKVNGHYNAIPTLVLTDGKTFIVIASGQKSVPIIDDKDGLSDAKIKALEKLLPEERALFDLPSPEAFKKKDV